MTRSPRRVALLAVGCALAVLVGGVGCGSEPDDDPALVVRRAVGQMQATPFAFDGSLRAAGPGGRRVLSMSVTGAADVERRVGRMVTRMHAPEFEVPPGRGGAPFPENMTTRTIVTGSAAYSSLEQIFGMMPEAFREKLPDRLVQAKWVKQRRTAHLFQDFMVLEPDQLLSGLREVARLERVGAGTVRGEPMAWYKGTIPAADLFAAAVGGKPKPADLRGAPRSFPVELWVDRAGLLRRVRLDVAVDSGPRFMQGSMTASVDLFDYGTPVRVDPPPPDEVVTQRELMREFARPGAMVKDSRPQRRPGRATPSP